MDAKLITRLIVSIVAILNMLAIQFKWTPIELDENGIYVTVSVIITIIIWARGFWKNNNFTEAAKLGQTVIDEIKADQKAYEKEQSEKPLTECEKEVNKNE